ncbi:MAG: hypothetical protein HOV79_29350 [Hamadaea sp.]|nr:hypothetical protein [Hamadaea sp.]
MTLRRIAVLGLLVAAAALQGCSGDSGQPQVASAGGTPTVAPTADVVGTYVEAVRSYVTCLRGEGLKVSDPDAKGRFTFEGDNRTLKADPKFRAAQQKCGGLLPPVPAELQDKPVLTAEQIEKAREYAKCMRDNGAPDFPDPGPDGYYPDNADGTPVWNQSTDAAIRAGYKCAYVHGGPTSPPVGKG